MSKVATGKRAPAFTLNGTGGLFSLRGARGEALVIYFYPRDNTSGCSAEAAQFAAVYPRFKKAGVRVFGISADTLKSHEKFKEKFKLPFDLLSDEERTVCKLFDVIQEKSMYGRKFLGIERSTFLIDAEGIVRQIWRKVKVDGHATAVLAAAGTELAH
jgi:peroxiredoxin Q/BCP